MVFGWVLKGFAAVIRGTPGAMTRCYDFLDESSHGWLILTPHHKNGTTHITPIKKLNISSLLNMFFSF